MTRALSPVGSVIAPRVFKMTVCPAELTTVCSHPLPTRELPVATQATFLRASAVAVNSQKATRVVPSTTVLQNSDKGGELFDRLAGSELPTRLLGSAVTPRPKPSATRCKKLHMVLI